MVEILVKLKPLFSQYYEKAKKYPHIWIGLVILLATISLIWLPYWRVSQFGINNATENATLENQYRATLAQILGGVALGIGFYYTWRRITIAEKDLKVSQEGQITERFTRAVDQLGAIDQFGKPAIEIRLGGIYSLERISNESDKDYWPIMEILTAYVRKNSSVEVLENKKVMHLAMHIQSNESTICEVPEERKISLDIQAVLTVLGERKYSFNNGEYKYLNLSKAHLEGADLREAHLEEADLRETHLEGADLFKAHLEGAHLLMAHLKGANLNEAHLEEADLNNAHLEGANLNEAYLEGVNLVKTHLEGAYLFKAHLEGVGLFKTYLKGAYLSGAHLEEASLWEAHLEVADLIEAHLEGADLFNANLDGANLSKAYLEGAKNLTVYQLSKVKTLYEAKLDDELLIPLKERYPALFEKPNSRYC